MIKYQVILLDEHELKKITTLFENMTASIVSLTKKSEEQDQKIHLLENQLVKSLDLNSDAIDTVANRFQEPIEDLSSRIAELENLLSTSTQVFTLLKESDITTKLQLVDGMFELLADLPLINLKILAIFMEFQNKIIDDSLEEEFIYTKNSQLQKELLEYNTLFANFIEQTRQS